MVAAVVAPSSPVVHDPHQAGGGLRGEDDAAVIELYRSKHDQAAEQTQRLVEPETHVPTPFLPAGKSIITQPHGKNNPPRAFFALPRGTGLDNCPKNGYAISISVKFFRKKNVHVPRAPRPERQKNSPCATSFSRSACSSTPSASASRSRRTSSPCPARDSCACSHRRRARTSAA